MINRAGQPFALIFEKDEEGLVLKGGRDLQKQKGITTWQDRKDIFIRPEESSALFIRIPKLLPPLERAKNLLVLAPPFHCALKS